MIIPFEYEKVETIHKTAVKNIIKNLLLRYLFKNIFKMIQKEGTAVMNCKPNIWLYACVGMKTRRQENNKMYELCREHLLLERLYNRYMVVALNINLIKTPILVSKIPILNAV